jgi:hypothetical protein
MLLGLGYRSYEGQQNDERRCTTNTIAITIAYNTITFRSYDEDT